MKIAPDADLVDECAGAVIDYNFSGSSPENIRAKFRAILAEAEERGAKREREACAVIAMEKCRELNTRATALNRERRFELAMNRECEADRYERIAAIIRARNAEDPNASS